MAQIMAAGTMGLITLAVVALLLLPIRLKFGTDLVKFYWRGVWFFLAAIASVSGGAEVLKILGYAVEKPAIAILAGIMSAYILFVVFGWFRLVGMALWVGFRKVKKPA